MPLALGVRAVWHGYIWMISIGCCGFGAGCAGVIFLDAIFAGATFAGAIFGALESRFAKPDSALLTSVFLDSTLCARDALSTRIGLA